ncbi:MAG TPA: glutamate--cysteine ligase [Gammaproteobacteria bacterium]|nr:glutamate--cysteine ligase [Gammaproteobacteria bacterium]
MSGHSDFPPQPVTDERQLTEYFASSCKPKDAWRIGTEHEKFAYRLDNLEPLPYDGEVSISALLRGFCRFGWEPVYEGDNLVALHQGEAGITLEPGGQLELSGAPVDNVHETCQEVNQHLYQAKEVAGELGVGLLGLGFQPKWARSRIPWMPKGRYAIMRDYMPTRGGHGLDMMLRSCTAQVNLDFDSEGDMVKKFQVAMALQPVATALFANSPFVEGRPTGYLSYRSHVWTDTDPDRCGVLPFVFDPGMGFERYTHYALDVPMYFVYRDGRYINAAGQSFRDFLAGRLPALPGEHPTLADWADHLSTLFPEVRMKGFLEMRGADGGPWRRLCALPAFWTGLLYDSSALDAAWDLVKDWTLDDHAFLRGQVPVTALNTPVQGHGLRDVALEALAISRAGLGARRRLSDRGEDETRFLDTLQEIAESNQTPAEELLEAYETRWHHEVEPVFKEYSY